MGVVAQDFTDVAYDLGVIHSMNSSNGFGGGVSFFDINNDGLDDLTFVMENDSVVVFLNNGDGFTPLEGMPHIVGETRHAIWVDYDNDGDNDLFVTTFADGSCRLFRNEGDLTLIDVTNESGLAGLISTNYGATFADYDRDGFLDLYLCRYIGFGSQLDPLNTNALFRNNGDGTFSDVTIEAGVGDGVQLSFMGGWLDFNKDGWPDLYVINDKPGWHNNLYINKGDGTFENMTADAGAHMYNDDPMSATFADFDNDGDLDWYSSNTGHASTRARLMVNEDDTFTEAAEEYGVALQAWAWGAAFFDFNNDTFLDLFVATGWTTGHWQAEVPSALYRSEEAQHFTQMPESAFSEGSVAASYGVAVGDYNNDGYPDLAVLNAKDYDSFLFRNNGSGNNYVKITLEGTVSNKMAIGSWITLYAQGQPYFHYTRCGENYCGQNSQHLIFGLADATTVDSVIVEFPSGHVDSWYDLPVNEHHYLVEGATIAAPVLASSTELCPGQSAQLYASTSLPVVWNTGATTQLLIVGQSGDYFYTLTTSEGFVVTSDVVTVVVEEVPDFDVQVISPSCFGLSDGSIEITGADGFDIAVTLDANTVGTIDLSDGNYSVTLTSPFGCTYSTTASLMQPDQLDLLVFSNSPPCSGDQVPVDAFVFGGTPPYTLTYGTQVENSLGAGTHIISVIDSQGCAISEEIVIVEPDLLTLNYTVFENQLNMTASGGVSPYTFQVVFPDGTLTNGATVQMDQDGSYTVLLTDVNECETQITLDHVVSNIYDQDEVHLKVYPNPAGDVFHIECSSCQLLEVMIFDLSGRMVDRFQINHEPKASVQINHLAQGVYYTQIVTTSRQVKSTRLVKH